MTADRRLDGAATSRGRWLHDPVLLWSAFILVHLALGLLNLRASGYPLGDVTSVYRFWSDQVVIANYWVGVDSGWVYPILAIVPMLAARSLEPFQGANATSVDGSAGVELYASTWLAMIMLLNLVAFGVLTGWGRRPERFAAGWWWTLFLACLGPIALGRIDSVTVPLAVLGVLVIATRPAVATIELTLAAWIKVWPGAIDIALLTVRRDRWRLAGVAAAVSAVIVAIALSFGSGANVLSFVTQQTSRALQVEAPITTYWLWRAAANPDTEVYFDDELFTWQVRGPGAAQAAEWMTPLLLLVVVAIVILALLARHRGASAAALLPPLTLALVTAMIAFQKVGSPQVVSWLAVPVILGLVTHRAGRGIPFRLPAAIAVVIAALTHVIYPYLYGYLIGLAPWMLTVISARNALLLMLLAVALHGVVRSARHPSAVPAVADRGPVNPSDRQPVRQTDRG